MRKLGETRPRAVPSQEEAEVADDGPLEKPLQKLIQKIVGDRSGETARVPTRREPSGRDPKSTVKKSK